MGRPTLKDEQMRRVTVSIRLPAWLADLVKNHELPAGQLIEKALIKANHLIPGGLTNRSKT